MFLKTDLQLAPFSSPPEKKTADSVRFLPAGMAVCLASSRASGVELYSPIPCRITSDCQANYLIKRIDIPDIVQCVCQRCGGEEIIVNWRNSWWDFHLELLRSRFKKNENRKPPLIATLPSASYYLLCQAWTLPRPLLHAFYRARIARTRYQIRLGASEQELLEEAINTAKLDARTMRILRQIESSSTNHTPPAST